MEKYSRGRRGAPAKGVGRATGARVQIPLSPLRISQKVLDKGLFMCYSYEVRRKCGTQILDNSIVYSNLEIQMNFKLEQKT